MRNSGYSSIIGDSAVILLACLAAISSFPLFLGAQPPAGVQSLYQNAKYQEVVRSLESTPIPGGEAALLLGQSQFQLGLFDAAAVSLARATAESPGSSEAHNWLGRAIGMQAERGNPLSAMGLARKARDQFQKAVELDGTNLEAINDLFSYYLSAPSFLGGGVDKARSLAETVKPLHLGEYASMQGALSEKAKDFAGAEKWYRQASSEDPWRIGPGVDLALFYTRRGMGEKALHAMEQGRRIEPTAPRLLFDEANLLVRSGRNPARARLLLSQYQNAAVTSKDPSPFDVKQLSAKLEKLEKDAAKR